MPNGSYGVESVSGLFRTNLAFSHAALTEEVREVPFEELMSEPVIRLVVRSDEHLDQGLGFLAEELGLHSVVFGTGDVAWLDIGPKGVSKATMLARLCERLEFDPTLTMAVGDSMNDIEMLKWAGVGVLMGHAVPQMHQYADVVTGTVPGTGRGRGAERDRGVAPLGGRRVRSPARQAPGIYRSVTVSPTPRRALGCAPRLNMLAASPFLDVTEQGAG